MTQIAVIPGTFDPLTYGHQELIQRAAKIFPSVIVAVATNKKKSPLFSLEQRVAMINHTFKDQNNIQAIGFDNLLVDFATAHKATVIIRGVRASTDFEYELQLANINRTLQPKLETIFITPTEHFSCVSSSFVKEIASLGGDASPFVNTEVLHALKGIVWP